MKRYARKFRALPARERLAVCEGVLTLVALTIVLKVVGFHRVRGALLVLARMMRTGSRRQLSLERVVWAVETARRHCPVRTTCLSEALTAEALFRQHRHDAVLCIGAARRDGAFTAHAWVESAGAVVIGGPESLTSQYARFSGLEQAIL